MVNVYKRRFAKEDRISNLPQELIELIFEELPVQDAARTIILSKTWRYRWTLVCMRMVNIYKMRFVTCHNEDRISNLPEQLIELILDKLPLQDAARTSILSKAWRYRWTSMNALVFSKQFSRFKMLRRQGFVHFEKMSSARSPDSACFSINGYILTFFMAETIPKCLPHTFNRLKRLDLLDINFGDLDQLQGVLCMLRNTPNLERLCVRNEHMECQDIHVNVEAALGCLQASDCLDLRLDRLQKVTFIGSESSKPEMLFIKLLLACSPTLKRMIIHPRVADNLENKVGVLEDLCCFHRASTRARVGYMMTNPDCPDGDTADWFFKLVDEEDRRMSLRS